MTRPGNSILISLAGLVIALAAFLIFQNLSSPAIRIWDEAIYADNALDMYSFGDPIVMRRNGEPTLYNTKPPLVIWLETLSIHVFGVNEFAIRFPSALAGLLTCILICLYAVNTLNDLRIGIVAILVLTTSQGFVAHHVVKTGDLDAVLVFWTSFYTLFFLYLLVKRTKKFESIIVWVGFGVVGAFLSKSVAGLIPVAGLVVCAFAAHMGFRLLRQWYTWLIAGLVVVACMSYYVIREYALPGYLYHVYYSEYTRFNVNILPWHNHPWYYYFWNWQRLGFFTPYVYWLPVAVLIGLFHKNVRKATSLMSIQVVVFIGVLSYPIVKLMWYDAPVYPLLALLCATGFVVLWDWFVQKASVRENIRDGAFILVLAGLFCLPVLKMFERNADLYLPVDILEREGFSIRELKRNHPEFRQYKVLMLAQQNAHYTQVDFYLNAYNRYGGYDISLLRDTTGVSPGDTILCCQDEQIRWLTTSYPCDTIDTNVIGCVRLAVGIPPE